MCSTLIIDSFRIAPVIGAEDERVLVLYQLQQGGMQ
jgi:hypothetical protein